MSAHSPIAPWVYDEKGAAYCNRLKRFALSGVLVPNTTNFVAKMAASGQSNPIFIEGPQDAVSEVTNLVGDNEIVTVGTGTLTSLGVAVTGTDTLFMTELRVGDIIIVAGQTATVAAIASNTALTTALAFNPVLAANAFAFYTTYNADVEQRMTVLITDMAYRRELMNAPVPVLHIFGDYRWPLWMKQTLMLERNQTLKFVFYNNSAAATGSFIFGLEAAKWQAEALNTPEVYKLINEMRRHRILCQPYWLTLDSTLQLAAAGTGTRFLTITKDIMFVIFNVYGHFISSGKAGNITAGFSVKLTEQQTGRIIGNQSLTSNMIVGTSAHPFPLPHPWVLNPATQVRADFTNLITDATTDVFLTLHGVAVYMGKSGLMDKDMLAEARRMYQAVSRPVLVPASVQG